MTSSVVQINREHFDRIVAVVFRGRRSDVGDLVHAVVASAHASGLLDALVGRIVEVWSPRWESCLFPALTAEGARELVCLYLADGRIEVRQAALTEIERTKDAGARAPLEIMLDDEVPQLRERARKVLSQLSAEPVQSARTDDPSPRAQDAPARHETLLKLLLGSPDLDETLPLLFDKSDVVRTLARKRIRVFMRTNRRLVANGLIAFVSTHAPHLSTEAIGLLGLTRDDRAVDLLGQGEWQIAERIRSLAHIGGLEAARRIVRLSLSPSPLSRPVWARGLPFVDDGACALSAMGTDGLTAVEELLEVEPQMASARGVGRLGAEVLGTAVLSTLVRWARSGDDAARQGAWAGFLVLGVNATTALLSLADAEDSATRCLAFEMLDSHHFAEFVPRFLPRRHDRSDNRERRAIWKMLMSCEDESVWQSLREDYSSADTQLRLFMVDVAGQSSNSCARDMLIEAVGDPDESVRQAGVKSLGRMSFSRHRNPPAPALKVLLRATEEPSLAELATDALVAQGGQPEVRAFFTAEAESATGHRADRLREIIRRVEEWRLEVFRTSR